MTLLNILDNYLLGVPIGIWVFILTIGSVLIYLGEKNTAKNAGRPINIPNMLRWLIFIIACVFLIKFFAGV